jgi:hypothetical protein
MDNVTAFINEDRSDDSGETFHLWFCIGSRIVCGLPLSKEELSAISDKIQDFLEA